MKFLGVKNSSYDSLSVQFSLIDEILMYSSNDETEFPTDEISKNCVISGVPMDVFSWSIPWIVP